MSLLVKMRHLLILSVSSLFLSLSFYYLFLRSLTLSAVYILSCLSDCLTTCLPLTAKIINSLAVPPLVLHPSHLCVSYRLRHIMLNDFLFSLALFSFRLMQT